MTSASPYPSAESPLWARARAIRLLALDVDGVLTNAGLDFHLDAQGQVYETKSFNALDGQGLKLIQASGIQVAWISGRSSALVEHRAKALGIAHLYLGREDKLEVLKHLAQQLALDWSAIAYCGDDLPDISAIRKAGLGLSVPNAPSYVCQQADYITQATGGQGAVREICDWLLQAQGTWQAVLHHHTYGV
ncbi:3-deoxy-D-manno-octulosonate 8-phosphate phosphatase (KDO 8-P phosphatase) [Allopseudospirillum japonicum]|uniref:3-deoxy-D-manno-octulosonate 8-phosphate phosphatase KdsC n=1 Tax=Allopseudospirillum japonicum TaxID=64971 RepID=A0A1H6QDQ6_9GAMM|nr:HAD hydrolase family protein [Allopseudospirillum japonicum]SEI40006.1 3-deoxy-D-manno-octulosonate 8-phosphate phosphatase (KDO 8-P phosphatase) [Allopseudospirillum japonicum]